MTTTTTTTNDHLANVPHPAGATRVHEWDNDGSRYFVGREWRFDGDKTRVFVDGTQYADGGPTHRFITVTEDGSERFSDLTADRARQLGEALIAAAGEVDRWAAE